MVKFRKKIKDTDKYFWFTLGKTHFLFLDSMCYIWNAWAVKKYKMTTIRCIKLT